MNISPVEYSFSFNLLASSAFTPLNLLINRLFSKPENAEEILDSYIGDDTNENLLSQIWNHSKETHEAKTCLIEAIAPHIDFADSMSILFIDDPLTAFLITASLGNVLKRKALIPQLEDPAGRRKLLECWKLLHSSFWEDAVLKREPLELVLTGMTQEERHQLFQLCFEECLPTEQGDLCSILVISPYKEEFAAAWGNTFDSDPDIDTKLCQLIHAIIANHRDDSLVPPILTPLLSFEGELNYLDQTAFNNLDKLTEREQGIILSCLLPLSLCEVITDHDPMTDRAILIGHMEMILSYSNSMEAKIRAVRFYFELVQDEETLIAWMTELQNKFSSVAKYIWPALSDSTFAFAATDPTTINLRSNLMRIGNLIECLERIKEDFQKLPPLLLALGMAVPEHKTWIVQAAPYCVDEQLKAVARLLKKHDMDILDTFSQSLMADQFKQVLEHLAADVLKLFAQRKTATCNSVIREIEQTHHEIQMRLIELELRAAPIEEKEYAITLQTLSELAGKIRLFSSNILNILLNVCRRHPLISMEKFWQEIPKIQRLSATYQAALRAEDSFFNRLEKLSPPLPVEPQVHLDELPEHLLKETGAEDWQEVGIFSGEDLQHLGYSAENTSNLKKYLAQPKLIENWKLLISKNLRSINSLIDSCYRGKRPTFQPLKHHRKASVDRIQSL